MRSFDKPNFCCKTWAGDDTSKNADAVDVAFLDLKMPGNENHVDDDQDDLHPMQAHSVRAAAEQENNLDVKINLDIQPAKSGELLVSTCQPWALLK